MAILENFTVIDLIKTRSASIAAITDRAIKFNRQTAEELRYPAYVQLLINHKNKQLAIRTCKQDAPNAVPFSKPEGEQRYSIKISSVAVADMIRKMAGWRAEDNWNIPGVYFADEEAIVYDVAAAFQPTSRAGRPSKHRVEEEAETVEQDEIEEEI